jgi:hypothetical protein
MIPNRIVTFFNLGDKPEPFRYWHYLCLRSMSVVNNPGFIRVLGAVEPTGVWWESAREFCQFVRVEPVTSIFGNPLAHRAHRADVMRLQYLQKNGGIYLDVDTLCVKPLWPLLRNRCVMAKEEGAGLCNAVILCEAGHPFLAAWLKEFRSFRGNWNSHACGAPWRVSQFPEIAPTMTVLPQSAFFLPDCSGPGLDAMHVKNHEYPDAYSHHLWGTKASPVLDRLTPADLKSGGTTFCRLARRFM